MLKTNIHHQNEYKNINSWLLRIAAAIILMQTLFFKITAAPESIMLFTKLGVEPWGRIGTGVTKLIASILLPIPATVFIGAFLSVRLMAGATLSHFAVIGMKSQGDGGQLFTLGIIVLFCCLIIMLMNKRQGLMYFLKIFKKEAALKSILYYLTVHSTKQAYNDF